MTILNGNQSRQYKRSITLDVCFTRYNEIIHEYPPFSDEATLFTQNNKRLVDLVSGKDVDGKGITTDKDKLKKLFAMKCAIICTRATAYAVKIGDNNLRNAVFHSESDVYRSKESDVLGFANRLSETITPLFSNDTFNRYAVTKDMLTEVVEMATKFNSTIGQATIVNSGSTYASKAINEVLALIRTNVKQFSMLINFFEEKHPGFVTDYYTAAAINDSGIHHNGIAGIITNAATGEAISGATVIGEGKNKIAFSNLVGDFKLAKIRSGLRRFTFTCPGYESQTITVKLSRGKTEECNVSLRSAIIALSATA